MYDLLVKRGLLIDPSQNLHASKDVALSEGRVAAVEDSINEDSAKQILDVKGNLVTPGLIDIHVHVYPGVSHYGIDPDPTCLMKGATTVVDAGSAGADTFQGFRRYVIECSATRIYAFLNISALGMIDPLIGELTDVRLADENRAIAVCEKNRDVIRGVKVRLSKEIVEENAVEALRRAKRVSEAVGMPLMVHVGETAIPLADILAEMRANDILTHCFHGRRYGILDEAGVILPEVRNALKRGVIFDVGHGRKSFSFHVAEKALLQGVFPETISSDLHVYNVEGPVYDHATTLSKFITLGLNMDDILARAITSPAKILGESELIGTLKPGAEADLAVFELREGSFEFKDTVGWTRKGRWRLNPAAVVKKGRIYYNTLSLHETQ